MKHMQRVQRVQPASATGQESICGFPFFITRFEANGLVYIRRHDGDVTHTLVMEERHVSTRSLITQIYC